MPGQGDVTSPACPGAWLSRLQEHQGLFAPHFCLIDSDRLQPHGTGWCRVGPPSTLRGEAPLSSTWSSGQESQHGGVAPTLLPWGWAQQHCLSSGFPLPGCNCQSFPLDCSLHMMPRLPKGGAGPCSVLSFHQPFQRAVECTLLPLFPKCRM